MKLLPFVFVVVLLSARAQNGAHSCLAGPAVQEISHDRPGFFAARYQAEWESHSGEPVYEFLYGLALTGAGTPQALRLLDQALDKDPEIAQSYLALAKIYASPVFRDPAKVAMNLKAYVSRCPQDLDAYSYLAQVDDPAFLREFTAKFRQAVEQSGSAGAYKRLWAAEFRIADAKERDRLRSQVRLDIEHIRQIDQRNADNSESLIASYRLLGDDAAADALRKKQAPARTFDTVFREWRAVHPLENRASYDDMYRESAEWVKDWPRETNAWNWRLVAVSRRSASSPAEIEKAGEDLLAADSRTARGPITNPYPMAVAEEWEHHDIRLRDCVRLLRAAMAQLDGNASPFTDLVPAIAPASLEAPHNVGVTRFRIWIAETRVDLKLKDLEAANAVVMQMKAWIDQHPDDSEWQTKIWHDYSGEIAEAEGRKLDALVQYQQGSQVRELKNRAKAIWSDLGGTPDEFNAWFKPPAAMKPQTAASVPGWIEQNRPLTFFHAVDLNGKSWTVADLKGRKTLFVIWATWCAPCRAELPQVQAFYEHTKDREDLRVLTISIDDNVGLIEPFLKAGGYTFPVLAAEDFADQTGDVSAIPRMLIVDSNGVARAERIGYGNAGDLLAGAPAIKRL